MALTPEEIENRFTYHPPTQEKIEQHQAIRDAAKELCILINAVCPDSREKSTSLTKLDEVVFHANAAIARHD